VTAKRTEWAPKGDTVTLLGLLRRLRLKPRRVAWLLGVSPRTVERWFAEERIELSRAQSVRMLVGLRAAAPGLLDKLRSAPLSEYLEDVGGLRPKLVPGEVDRSARIPWSDGADG